MQTAGALGNKVPLTESTLVALSKLVDDALTGARAPSHSELAFQITSAGLACADPNQQGQAVGKAKRVRAVLSWAIENNLSTGEDFCFRLLSLVRGCGGFREGSQNFVGCECIETLRSAFKVEGFDLAPDGTLHPLALESLSGVALTDALQAYVRRAKQGVADAALLTGTSKDLVEATAAHVLVEKWGSYPSHSNFPALLGQAFVALGFATPQDPIQAGEPVQRRLERALYETACAVNALRNKQGTGHGRPWVTTLNDAEARVAIEIMGCVAERMLAAL
jgi:hypothetical protein